jgi:hypothetical protein
MEKRFEVLPPTMPNFVRFKHEPQLRQDGFKVNEGFDIANFTKEEADEFAQLMYDSFLTHWRKRRESK